MPLFNKSQLEGLGSHKMTIEEYVKLGMHGPLNVHAVGKNTEFGWESEMIPLRKVSFQEWRAKDSDHINLLTKIRYRRMKDYDMWIDLDNYTIYVDINDSPYYKSEIDGIIKDCKSRWEGPFKIKDGIPKSKFNLIGAE